MRTPLDVLGRFLLYMHAFDWAGSCLTIRGPVPRATILCHTVRPPARRSSPSPQPPNAHPLPCFHGPSISPPPSHWRAHTAAKVARKEEWWAGPVFGEGVG